VAIEQPLKSMLRFLVHNILERVFQRSVGIAMGNNYASALAGLFSYSYEAGHVQKLLQDKNKKKLLCPSTVHIDILMMVLSINNNIFHNYVHLIILMNSK
jgi:hypothetical protein